WRTRADGKCPDQFGNVDRRSTADCKNRVGPGAPKRVQPDEDIVIFWIRFKLREGYHMQSLELRRDALTCSGMFERGCIGDKKERLRFQLSQQLRELTEMKVAAVICHL